MPFWAYLYCAVIGINSIIALCDKNRLKKNYQPAGEILSALCCLVIIFIAFERIHISHASLVSSLCLLYTCLWSWHAYRHYFDKTFFFNMMTQEDEQEAPDNYLERHAKAQDTRDHAHAAKLIYVLTLLIVFLFSLPLFYAYYLSLR